MSSNTARIVSIGTATPSARLPRDAWLTLAGQIAPSDVSRALLARLADRSEIDGRAAAAVDPPLYSAGTVPGTAARMQLWSRTARAMAHDACAAAIADAQIEPRAITHVVTASCTGFESPGVDAHLIESLGLARGVARTNIGFMGCHAAVNALAAARNAAIADPAAQVLVCCAEVCSAHFHHSARVDQLVANTLFGDGAAAAIVRGGAHGHDDAAPALAATHSVLLADTADEMRWTIGDHGFEMTLGARVPDVLRAEVGAWVASSLATHGLAIGDVGAWAIHPGGPRVIDSVVASLGIPAEAGDASRAVLRAHGNMSSATLLFILDRLRKSRAPRPWVGLAFGPGLVGEMVLLR